MTAIGELYVDETCRDAFTKELNKEFGEDKWRLDGSNYGYIWSDNEIPPEMTVDVLDIITDEILGKVKIINKYAQVYDDMRDCMFLEPKPDKMEVLSRQKEGNNEGGQEKTKGQN